MHSTKTSFLYSPLTNALVITHEPLTHPHVDYGRPAWIASTSDLPEVRLKGSQRSALWGLQYWVHQNTGNHLDGGIKQDVKWQARWKNFSVCQPNGIMHHLVEPGESLYWWHTSLEVEHWLGNHFSVGHPSPRPTHHCAKNNCAQIKFLFHWWNHGAFEELVNDTCDVATGYLGVYCVIQSKEQHHCTSSNFSLRVKLREAVRFFCEWKTREFLNPTERHWIK